MRTLPGHNQATYSPDETKTKVQYEQYHGKGKDLTMTKGEDLTTTKVTNLAMQKVRTETKQM